MKYIIFCILNVLIGCDETRPELQYIAEQHVGRGVVDGDICTTLYRTDGREVATPSNFNISPFEAIAIVKSELNYSCSNKLGAQILSDGEAYYIVRLGIIEDAIVVNGFNGEIESKGFMK